MAKKILYQDNARRALERGMEIMVEAVSVTLGPKGRNVVLEKPYGSPQIVNDGVTIAKEIKLVGNDPDGDAITYSIVDQPTDGTVTLDGATATYTSNSDTATSDSFTFIVQANGLESIPTTVIINITGTNDAPVAENQTVNVTDKVTETITLLASDPENDALSYTIVDDNGRESKSMPKEKKLKV